MNQLDNKFQSINMLNTLKSETLIVTAFVVNSLEILMLFTPTPAKR